MRLPPIIGEKNRVHEQHRARHRHLQQEEERGYRMAAVATAMTMRLRSVRLAKRQMPR